MKLPQIVAIALSLTLAGAAFAKGGKEGKHSEKHHEKAEKHKFDNDERGHIEGWYAQHPGERDGLPPGLAKKGKVPPGWKKKWSPGERVSDDVWVLRVPVPQDVIIKLPIPPPPGVVLVRIGDQILKVREKTHEVLDRIGLPHPP